VVPGDERFGAFLAVAALLIVTPGPDTALVTRNALRPGSPAAWLTAAGVGAGTRAWAIASALGVAVLLERSLIAFTALKLGGAAYLAYLGLRSLLEGFRPKDDALVSSPLGRPAPLDHVGAFRQVFLSNLLNPKVGVFFVAVIPQFVQPADPPGRFLVMLVAYEAMLLGWLGVFGLIVGRVGRSPAGARVRRAMQRVTGVVLIGLGVRLAFERR
jgi:threonine/homoserine/homoserine lactone efflux protein